MCTTKKPLDKELIFEAANGRWNEVFAQLAPELDEAMAKAGRHVTCPHPDHGGADDFRLFKDYKETGGGICTCGGGRDGIAVLRWLRGWSFPEAIEAVGEVLGLERAPGYVQDKRGRKRPRFEPRVSTAAETTSTDDAEDMRRRRKLKEAWSQGISVMDDDAAVLHAYLANRGLDPLAAVHALDGQARFHPALPLWEKGEKPGDKPVHLGDFPALLTLVRNGQGEPVTIHRTWLAEDGSGKAPVNHPRKVMARPGGRSFQGAHIPLGGMPEDGVIGVAEGIETALAAFQATRTPTWPCIAEKLLRQFVPPAGTKGVIVFADRDSSGIGVEAAQELATRLDRDYQIPTRVVVPPAPTSGEKADWLDTLNEYGAEGFPQRRGQRRAAA